VTVAAVNGVATFSGLSLSQIGSYTLQAASAALSPATSANIAINSMDLAATLGTTWTLPAQTVTGRPLTGKVSVVVSNLGNVPLPKGQKVNIQILAHDTTNPANPANPDITLAALANRSVSSLAANGATTFTASVSRPAGLPLDSYDILAKVTPVQALTEARTDNNIVTNPAHPVVSVSPLANLSGTSGPHRMLPGSGIARTALKGYVSVVVTRLAPPVPEDSLRSVKP
jgi:hypothetical protein